MGLRRDRLEQKVYTYINREKMVAPGQRVLLAVSGGADSMALLSIMAGLAPRLNIKLAVAHLDHSLRATSWREAELVEKYCRELQVPFYLRTTDVRTYCQEHQLGIEAGAREVRHQWLRESAVTAGAELIATAHHRDDQAETILLHLLRGSGLKGLGGMAPRGELYIRPLLTCSKEELVAYLAAKPINYIEDESNQDPVYLRNRIRHQLLPLLEADYNSAIRDRLVALGELAREDFDYLDKAAQQVMANMVTNPASDTWCVELTPWFNEHPAMQKMVLLRLLTAVRGQEDFTKSDVDALIKLTRSQGSSKQIILAGSVSAHLQYGKLYLRPWVQTCLADEFAYDLTIPGQVLVKERSLLVQTTTEQPAAGNSLMISLKADACPPQIQVRNRRSGDRIQLPGGSKKLSDWFVDHKVPLAERCSRLLLTAGQQVIWVENGPVSTVYRAQGKAKRIWVIVSAI